MSLQHKCGICNCNFNPDKMIQQTIQTKTKYVCKKCIAMGYEIPNKKHVGKKKPNTIYWKRVGTPEYKKAQAEFLAEYKRTELKDEDKRYNLKQVSRYN